MVNFPFTDDKYALWLQITRVRAAISTARQNRVGKYIHHNQAAALVSIWAQNGKATPAMLSRSLFLKKHTVSELLSRMEENGLITKKKDEKIRRMVRIEITEKGREVCRQVTQYELILRIMSSLSEEQREQLKSCLNTLFDTAAKELGRQR